MLLRTCCNGHVAVDMPPAGGRPTAGTIAQPNQQAAASPKPSPAPVFLEGVADMRAISDMYDRAFYRLLATPTATWMYVEKLLSQEHALRFCAIAGGKLASFSSAAETAQVEQLLNATLAPRAESNYDARSANVVIWIDLKRAAGEGNEARWSWQSLVRGVWHAAVQQLACHMKVWRVCYYVVRLHRQSGADMLQHSSIICHACCTCTSAASGWQVHVCSVAGLFILPAMPTLTLFDHAALHTSACCSSPQHACCTCQEAVPTVQRQFAHHLPLD